jgi:DnaJ-class molecular chaperone
MIHLFLSHIKISLSYLNVGNLRKKLNSQIQLRSLQDTDERNTLLPCDACTGQGYRVQEKDGRRYTMKPCIWCQGMGAVIPEIAAAFRRWKNIMKCNKCKEISNI